MNIFKNIVGYSPVSNTNTYNNTSASASASASASVHLFEPELADIADSIYDQYKSQGFSEAEIQKIARLLVSKCSKDIGTQTYETVLEFLLTNKHLNSSEELFGSVGDLGFSTFFDDSKLLQLAPELAYEEIEQIGVKNNIPRVVVSNARVKNSGDIRQTATEILFDITNALGSSISLRDFMLSLKNS